MDELLGIIGVTVLGLIIIATITPTKEELKGWQTQTIQASQDEIFRSAITYLQDRGFTISDTNQNSGFIKTGWASQFQLQGAWGILEEAVSGETRSSVTVVITPIGNYSCEVRVNLVAQNWTEGPFIWSTGHWEQTPLYYGEDDYQRFFQELRQEIA